MRRCFGQQRLAAGQGEFDLHLSGQAPRCGGSGSGSGARPRWVVGSVAFVSFKGLTLEPSLLRSCPEPGGTLLSNRLKVMTPRAQIETRTITVQCCPIALKHTTTQRTVDRMS